MKIFDERVSNGVDRVEYRIKVKQFRERMEKWKPGRKITNVSKFHYLDSEFELIIYPNGYDDGNKGFVSIFLKSNNSHDLYVTYSMSMGLERQSLEDQKILSNQGMGFTKFYSHFINEFDDDKLEIICIVSKIMTDPARGYQIENNYQMMTAIRSDVRDLLDSHSKEKGRLLERENDTESKFTNILQGQMAMQIEFQKKMDEVTKSMQELKSVNNIQQQQHQGRFDDLENDVHYNEIPKPKCVTCRSNLTSTSQIDQCPAGHLLCLICKNISRVSKCPICFLPMTRATGLESYLKILFPITAENYDFLSKPNMPRNILNIE